mmetsp:Transcript_48614/g.72562  ORF Transcript_48614/g.72562 Transcript_48614/m.72562 type:complete len:92 (+) Transcript_48614:163-438(+)
MAFSMAALAWDEALDEAPPLLRRFGMSGNPFEEPGFIPPPPPPPPTGDESLGDPRYGDDGVIRPAPQEELLCMAPGGTESSCFNDPPGDVR